MQRFYSECQLLFGFNKIGMCGQIYVDMRSIKFAENPFRGSGVVTLGTDGHVVPFFKHFFTDMPEDSSLKRYATSRKVAGSIPD
jgi:hypothetical protein